MFLEAKAGSNPKQKSNEKWKQMVIPRNENANVCLKKQKLQIRVMLVAE